MQCGYIPNEHGETSASLLEGLPVGTCPLPGITGHVILDFRQLYKIEGFTKAMRKFEVYVPEMK
jgi:hypothetical protein